MVETKLAKMRKYYDGGRNGCKYGTTKMEQTSLETTDERRGFDGADQTNDREMGKMGIFGGGVAAIVIVRLPRPIVIL